MAIEQSKKQSDLEKRLKLLRQQVYGKSVSSIKYQVVREEKQTISRNAPTAGYQLHTSDITYLHQDLLKISVFASIAIGVQIILFFLMKNQILNLKF